MADLSKIRVVDCEFSVRTTNCLTHLYGHDVTLARLDAMTDEELRRTPHFGQKSLREIREVIETAKVATTPVRDDRLAGYHQLHDRLSDMIENGRLRREYIPDDYDWIVETLACLC